MIRIEAIGGRIESYQTSAAYASSQMFIESSFNYIISIIKVSMQLLQKFQRKRSCHLEATTCGHLRHWPRELFSSMPPPHRWPTPWMIWMAASEDELMMWAEICILLRPAHDLNGKYTIVCLQYIIRIHKVSIVKVLEGS